MNILLRDSNFAKSYRDALGDFAITGNSCKTSYLLNNQIIARALHRNRISHLVIYDTNPESVSQFICVYGVQPYSYIFKTRNTDCTRYEGIIKPFTYAINNKIPLNKYLLPVSFMFCSYYKTAIFENEVFIIHSISICKSILLLKEHYKKYRFALIDIRLDWHEYLPNSLDIINDYQLLSVFGLIFCNKCMYYLLGDKIRKCYIGHTIHYVVAKSLIDDEKRCSNTKSAR